MNHHARRLVDHHQVIVLEYDVQRNLLRQQVPARRWRYGDIYRFAATRLVAGAFPLPVNENVALGNERRGLVARDVEPDGNENIQPAAVFLLHLEGVQCWFPERWSFAAHPPCPSGTPVAEVVASDLCG